MDPSVPAKRKLSQDVRVDAQRAYIARTAPHLLEDGANGSSSPPPGSPSQLPSSLSPTPTPGPLHYYDDDGRERSGSRGPRLSTPPTPAPAQPKSHHTVPKRYRGPQPLLGDAEDIAPLPTLVAVPGCLSLFDTINYPLNRNGWRYVAAGPCSASLPHSVYRTLDTSPRGIHWSWTDRSPYTHISNDAAIVSSDRGFRSARTNVPVRQGSWYVEVHILEPETMNHAAALSHPDNHHNHHHNHDEGSLPAAGITHHHGHGQTPIATAGAAPRRPMSDGPHVRLGWGRREAPLNAPVGFDGYSYGLRDTNGDKVFLSRPQSYGCRFGPGDVVGMYISIPSPDPNAGKVDDDPLDPARIRRKRLPIRYKSQLYFESLEYAQTKEMEALMERSRRGDKDVVAALSTGSSGAVASCLHAPLSDGKAGPGGHGKGIKGGVDPPGSGSGGKGSANGAGTTGSSAKKRKGGANGPGGPKEAPSNGNGKKAEAALRPLPTLGSESKIGFFINGEPQGIAFRDLLDFRPLRRAAADKQQRAGGSGAASGNTTSLSLADLDEGSGTVITSSSSLASIVKSRENAFDDGAMGYFPFVSLFGGARARIVSRREDFAFCPPDDIERALDGEGHGGTPSNWRPLAERYDEFVEEMWRYDIEDEARAAARYQASKDARGGKSESSESESGDSSGGGGGGSSGEEEEEEGGEAGDEAKAAAAATQTNGEKKRKAQVNGGRRGSSNGSSARGSASARNSRSATPSVPLNGTHTSRPTGITGTSPPIPSPTAALDASISTPTTPPTVMSPVETPVVKQEDDGVSTPAVAMELVEHDPDVIGAAEAATVKDEGEFTSPQPQSMDVD